MSLNEVARKFTGLQIAWTASKAALIELLYALQTNGSCNNGSIDFKELRESLIKRMDTSDETPRW
ncbi:MAG TPA: RteC domain-containing protein [Chitinophagaceae bacterium]